MKEIWAPLRIYIHESVLTNSTITKKVEDTGFIFIDCEIPINLLDQINPQIILGSGSIAESEYEKLEDLYE